MKVTVGFLPGVAMAVLVSACSGAPSAPTSASPTAAQQAEETSASPPAMVRVAVPTDDNLQFMTFWVAQGGGFFEAEGLDVQVIVPPMPGAAGRFMLMGRADVAVLAPPMYLNLIGQGQPVLLFANLFQNDPINLVVRKEVAEGRGLSADMPLAERLNGMRGLKVGVAPGPQSRLRVLFGSAGLDAETDIEMVVVPGEGQNEAFEQRLVDALYAHTPYLETALVDQGALMLVNQSAGEVPELEGGQYHTLVTSRDYAASNPDVLLAMTRAVYRTQQFVHGDLQATADAIRASQARLEVPHGLETIVAIYEPAIPLSPEVSVEGIRRELELYPAHQTPPDLSGIDLAAHVTVEFARQAPASP